MTEEQDNKEQEQTNKQALDTTGNEHQDDIVTEETDQKKSNTGLIIAITLLLAIAALSIYNFSQINKVSDDVEAPDFGSKFNDISQKIDQEAGQRQSLINDIESKLSEFDNRQQSLQSQLAKQARQQASQSTEINVEFALAEIEYLLTLANYRLQLNQDIATAVTAIEMAEKRIQSLEVPGKTELRQQLIADINDLKSINQADLSGLGLFLADLIDRVDELPLNEDAVINDPAFSKPVSDNDNQENTISDFFSLVWQELKSLVIISRDENVSKVMLLPDQLYFLRSNIKLELANARFAVFNRDTANFVSSVELIETWLKNYFNISDAAVSNILQSLTSMKELELTFPTNDLSSSIESVRAISRQLEQKDQ